MRLRHGFINRNKYFLVSNCILLRCIIYNISAAGVLKENIKLFQGTLKYHISITRISPITAGAEAFCVIVIFCPSYNIIKTHTRVHLFHPM